MKTIFYSCLLLCFTINSWANNFETVETRNRLPKELAETIKPLLNEGEKVIGTTTHLVIQATPKRLEALKTLVYDLDKAQKQLLVHVVRGKLDQTVSSAATQVYRTSNRNENKVRTVRVQDGQMARVDQNRLVPIISSTYGYQASASKTTQQDSHYFEQKSTVAGNVAEKSAQVANKQAEISQLEADLRSARINNSPEASTIPAEITAQQTQLQTLQTDLSKLSAQLSAYDQDQLTAESSQTELGGVNFDYKNLPEGLYVRPRVQGQKVAIEVFDHNSSYSGTVANIEQSAFQSTVIVPFGQWQQLMSQDSTISQSQSTVFSTAKREASNEDLWIKVELVD